MLFFFKQKPIEIVAMVSEDMDYVKEFSPITYAKEDLPEWWRKVPNSKFNWETGKTNLTVKNCPGIINHVTMGLIMPMWCDLALTWNNESYSYKFSDRKSLIHHHPGNQAPGFYEDYFITKLVSPWKFKTSIQLLYAPPFYHRSAPVPFEIPLGMAESFNGYSSSNIFCFLKKSEEEKRFMINHKDPLMHIIPITDKKIILKMETVSNQEYNRVSSKLEMNFSFTRRGLKGRKFNT